MAYAITTPILTFGALLLLGACSTQTPSGTTAQSYSNNHTTAAGGFGLGPEDFNTNGGAFGPDQGSASDSLSSHTGVVRQ